MLVLGVVGSPRREAGVSCEMVEATLAGARDAGAETATVYLADYDLTPCRHCGGSCFSEGYCEHDREATLALREVVEASDALVLAAPVYMWQPAGLTALFMEKLRLRSGTWNNPNRNQRAGLGIAVAGGYRLGRVCGAPVHLCLAVPLEVPAFTAHAGYPRQPANGAA